MKYAPQKIKYHGYVYYKIDLQNPIKGGYGDDMLFDEINPAELERGARIEKEHVGNLSDPINYAIARDIARDHIKEFPNYYDGLEKMEKSLAKQNGTVDED
jgi:hypothetical protein